MLCSVVKYWHRTLLMENDELLKCCYELQVGNLKCDGCPRHLSDRLYKIGLGCICLGSHGRDLKNIHQIIKTLCNDIQRQSNREKMKDSKVLVSYWNMKQESGRLNISRFCWGCQKERVHRNLAP
jgi:ribosomal protein L33